MTASDELILVDRVGKKFHRTVYSALLQGLGDAARKALRLRPRTGLGRDEFWALKDISFSVRRGECLGVIGPNGAGKTTLLKLLHRQFRPDAGRLLTRGSMKSLIRIGSGLQFLLSGRENIYIQCQQLGLDKRRTDAIFAGIVAFAGLEEAIDRPVKTYSDGMYARLEFSIATAVRTDVLLVDEVLAVGDIAFQIRALERLNQLKREGSAIVFVSHSEMNVRQVADRCLLLFDGQQIALGAPDALFDAYYQSVGYLNRRLGPLGGMMGKPEETAGEVDLTRLVRETDAGGGPRTRTGAGLRLALEYRTTSEAGPARLILHFWNSAGALAASVDSGLARRSFRLHPGRGEIRLRIPFLGLTPGIYHVAAGFQRDGEWLAYRGRLLELVVAADALTAYPGLSALEAEFEE